MENATKALLIAGEVLLAIVIITIFIYMINNISTLAQSQEAKKETAQIVAFNNQYEIYNKKIMYGTDLISLINKVINNNEKSSDQIQITYKYIDNDHIYDISTYMNINKNEEQFKELKKKHFSCISISYNEETGKVNKMNFEEV